MKTCDHKGHTVKTVIHNHKLIEGCDKCIPLQQGNESIAKHNRDYQKIQYRRDLTQPNQKEYFKAFPDKAREMHGDDLARKYS